MTTNVLSNFALTLLKAHVEQISDSYNPAASELRELTTAQVEDLYRDLLKEHLLVRTDNVVDVNGERRHTYKATAKGVTRIEEAPGRV